MTLHKTRTRSTAWFVLLALLSAVGIMTASPAHAVGQYPLRHDFSLTPGLPNGNGTTPTSCFNSPDGGGYVCRLIWGYEETGGNQDFEFPTSSALQTASNATYGSAVVTSSGGTYEGCAQIDGGRTWSCDYKTTESVSRQHYQSNGYVLKVLWNWTSYTGDQLACASSVVGIWSGSKAFVVLLASCKNGPM